MKITQEKFDLAQTLHIAGISNKKIAEILSVSTATISHIVRTKTLDEYHAFLKSKGKAEIDIKDPVFDNLRALSPIELAIETLEMVKQLLLSCKTKNV